MSIFMGWWGGRGALLWSVSLYGAPYILYCSSSSDVIFFVPVFRSPVFEWPFFILTLSTAFFHQQYLEAGNTRSSVSEPDLDPLSLYETEVVLFYLGAFLYNPSLGFYFLLSDKTLIYTGATSMNFVQFRTVSASHRGRAIFLFLPLINYFYMYCQ